MEEEEITAGDIAKEDVIDALADTESGDGLSLLTEYYVQRNGKNPPIKKQITNARIGAELVYKAKRYEDVSIWLDEIATLVSDEYGPDSEEYMAFTEDEELETLRMNASDRTLGDEEEDGYDESDE